MTCNEQIDHIFLGENNTLANSEKHWWRMILNSMMAILM